MQVMIMAKEGDCDAPRSMPTQEDMDAFAKYNEELVKAGIVLGAGRLEAAGDAVHVEFAEQNSRILDGPFTEAKEMIAGYWLWQVKSMDEAIEWLRRAPFREGKFEIRRVLESQG